MKLFDNLLDKMKLSSDDDEYEDDDMMDDDEVEEERVSRRMRKASTKEDTYDDDDEEEYTIVGTNEADPFSNKISNESPIAQAVIGKKEGDKVSVDSPNGSFNIEILKIA